MSTWSRRNPGADTIGRLPGRGKRKRTRDIEGLSRDPNACAKYGCLGY